MRKRELAILLGMLPLALGACEAVLGLGDLRGGGGATTTTSSNGATSGANTATSTNTGSAGSGCMSGPICGQAQCQPGVYCSACGFAGWPIPNPPNAMLPNAASYDTSTPGVVLDNVTKLTWQASLDAPNSQGKSCAAGCTEAEALDYCAKLVFAGHCDWRLPTRIELVSIVDYTRQTGAAIDPAAFPSTPTVAFWTSSPASFDSGSAWYVQFGDGSDGTDVVSSAGRVRCVR